MEHTRYILRMVILLRRLMQASVEYSRELTVLWKEPCVPCNWSIGCFGTLFSVDLVHLPCI